MIDYHLHLVPHGTATRFGVDDVRAYARAAAAAGVEEIAITEHCYRFPEAQQLVGSWWEDDPHPALREQIARYFAEERLGQSLAEYVDTVLEVAGTPREGEARVRLGLEVDLFPGRMDDVASLLARHPFDVLLGSVHWLGAWGFDQLDDPVVDAEWDRRDPDAVWLDYVAAVEAMARSGACDVLAHVDLAKVRGVRARDTAAECEERLVKAAAGHDLAVEVSSAGWRKPVGEAYPSPRLLASYHDAGVGATLASDAHAVGLVADRVDDAAATARAAGYTEVLTFERRRPSPRPLAGAR